MRRKRSALKQLLSPRRNRSTRRHRNSRIHTTDCLMASSKEASRLFSPRAVQSQHPPPEIRPEVRQRGHISLLFSPPPHRNPVTIPSRLRRIIYISSPIITTSLRLPGRFSSMAVMAVHCSTYHWLIDWLIDECVVSLFWIDFDCRFRWCESRLYYLHWWAFFGALWSAWSHRKRVFWTGRILFGCWIISRTILPSLSTFNWNTWNICLWTPDIWWRFSEEMTRFVLFLMFCFVGCEGIRSRGADVRRHQDNQEQEAVFATGAGRGQITGHYETPRGRREIWHR